MIAGFLSLLIVIKRLLNCYSLVVPLVQFVMHNAVFFTSKSHTIPNGVYKKVPHTLSTCLPLYK